jgi:hypothetical protein
VASSDEIAQAENDDLHARQAAPPAKDARTAGAPGGNSGFSRFSVGGAPQVAGRVHPDPAWVDDETPPGSMFSREEWVEARRQGEQANGGRPVFLLEMRNAGQAAFMSLPAPPKPQIRTVRGPGGTLLEKLVPPAEEELRGSFNGTIGLLIDGCLLLAPSASTSHPEAASHSSVRFSTASMGVQEYRLARPRAHMATERAIFSTTRMTQPLELEEPAWEPQTDECNEAYPRERG